MVLVISAQQPQLNGAINPRFGRSPWFVKMDTQTKDWEALPNPGADQSGGAGITAAQFVVDQGANLVISGDFGPNAAKVLQAANVEMSRFPEDVKTVEDVIKQFEKGELK